MNKRILFLAVATVISAQTALAQSTSLSGYFIALKECAANKKKDSDNPGNVAVEPMRAYSMIGRNANPGTHYQITVPGAPDPKSRWVPMTCGAYAPKDSLVLVGGTPPSPAPAPPPSSGLAPDSIEYVLAASWQPAFCATRGRTKPECTSQTPDRFDATHFSLHGLWPDDLDDKKIFPCYCDKGAPVSCGGGSQSQNPNISLSQPVMDQLRVVMPGVQSDLHLHEWSKHGSCYEDDETGADAGATPDEYFTEALAVMQKLNDSPVQQLFAQNLGSVLSREQIEQAFDDAFGAGAGDRVVIRCDQSGGSSVITELWIGLKGDIAPTPDLGSLILAAPPSSTASDQQSCSGGRVVEVDAGE